MPSRKIETTTEQWGKLPTIPGVHDILSTNFNARRFTLSLPNRIDSKNGNPIVLILHYGGDPTPYYGRPLIETLYQPNWHELDAIMIAPESSGGSWDAASPIPASAPSSSACALYIASPSFIEDWARAWDLL